MVRAWILGALLVPTWAQAATLRVGSVGSFTPGAVSYADLTAAVGAAVNGDVIEIGNGTFNGQITISGKSLTLRSVATGGSRPILQTTSAQHAMTVTSNAVVTFEGLQWTSGAGRRCMRVTGNADVVLEDVVFQDCVHNDSGAALYVASGSTVTGSSTVFRASAGVVTLSAADKGGGFLWAQGEVVLEGGQFEGGTATRGGAIWVDGGTVSLRPLGAQAPQLSDNVAVAGVAVTSCGGAICLSSGSLALQGVYLADNTSAVLGGHVGVLAGSLLDVDGAWLRGAAVHGGALAVQGGASATLRSDLMWDNVAVSTLPADVPSGGAIWASGAAELILDEPDLLRNEASRGGALYITGSGGVVPELTWTGGAARDGEAITAGAVYVDDDVTGVIEDVLFADNITLAGASASHGGALVLDRPGPFALQDLIVRDNVAVGDGGGLWWSPGSTALTVSGGAWSGNSAEDGGAIAVEGAGDLDLFDLDLWSNRAGTGGALRQQAGTLDAVRTMFCANAATGEGGAAWLGNVTSSIRASLLQENQGSNGAGVRATGGSLSLVHAHLLGNRVTGAATGAAVASSSASILLRSSLVGWTETGRGVVATAAPTAVASHNSFWANAGSHFAGLTSPSSLQVDPQLLAWDRDGLCDDDQPWPVWTSPLRDVAFSGTDPDGTPADIGAFGGAEATGTPPWTLDGDSDLAVWAADCNDASASVRPGAVETPADGVDQDCDRAEACWTDADRDGVGSAGITEGDLACITAGLAATGGDCDDNDPTERPGVQWYRDGDGDGWGSSATTACARSQASDVSRSGDCNDSAAGVSPGATELPADGVDQTCDGNELCYRDNDGDGFGGAATFSTTSLSCSPPPLTVVSGDCDDTDADERPGVTWYPDGDRDGFGAASATGTACGRAASTDVPNRSDCDDTRSAVRPGATELPADNTDQDCDGREQCWYDLDGDGYGRNATVLVDGTGCNRSGVSSNSSDCDDDATDDTPADQAALKYPGSTHWLDVDGDGWGRTSAPRVECNLSPGYSVRSGDCVDDPTLDTQVQVAALIYPNATYWADGDGDGWGRADAPNRPTACGLPPGHATRAGDCRDGDDDVYPGATYWPDADGDGWGDADAGVASPEVCEPPTGLITQGGDCDDDASDDRPGLEAALIRPGGTYYNDRDGDGWGSGAALSIPGVCDPPAGYKTRGGDCVDDPARNTPGAESAGIYPQATYWADVDGDGWGDDAAAVQPDRCGLPSAHATRPGDCDDDPNDDRIAGDAARTRPGAIYGLDADGDGWGQNNNTTSGTCAVPAGYAAALGDCDDDPADDARPGDAALTRPGATYFLDLDGDGYGPDSTALAIPTICTPLPGYALRGGDCDDDARDDTATVQAAAVFPGATYWTDRDGDGYGDGDLPVIPEVCGLPPGASTRDDDCDDDPSDDRPGAEASAIHPDAMLYVDADGDTWGDDASLTLISDCSVGTGWSSRGGDCDDNAADDQPGVEAAGQYPGAPFWPDRDGDGHGGPGTPLVDVAVCFVPPGWSTRDDDCDDDPTDDTPSTAAARVFPGAVYWLDVDGDGWGGGVPAPSACALPAGASVRDGDCDDDPGDDQVGREAAGIHPEATYWWDRDGDGFGALAESVRPADCGLPPGASTRDDDCDDDASDDAPPARMAASIWPGAPLWRDADGDGWGGVSIAVDPATCEPPAGTSVTPGDCDDDASDDTPGLRAADIWPGARWWADADGDTWGADGPGMVREACTLVPGLIARAGDCDDDPDDDTVGVVAALIHPEAVYFRDQDGDGYGAGRAVRTDCALPPGHSVRDDDCDDDPSDDQPGIAASEVYPGATWYLDADADGWGDPDRSQAPAACGPLPGAVTRTGDCDDDPADDSPGAEAARIHPDATYHRDADADGWGDDQATWTPPDCGLPPGASTRGGDCDDDASDDEPGREAARVWPGAPRWRDDDGDRWGDPGTTDTSGCGLPAGSVSRSRDCDDTDPQVNPDQPERPGNGADDDCDGERLCFVDVDGDLYGRLATVPDDGDGRCVDAGEAENADDCDDDPSDDEERRFADQIFPGHPEVCGDGVDSDCSCASAGVCDDEAGDEDGDGLSWSAEVALSGDDCRVDTDGDGLDDATERDLGSALNLLDTDGDGVSDALEAPEGVARNTDCAPDAPEGTLCDELPDVLDADDDGDGVSTLEEGTADEDCLARDALVLSPDGQGAWVDFDSDGDGTPDIEEAGRDDDGDGVDDRVDCEEGDASADPDCDGLRNGVERFLGTSTTHADSDGDGLGDDEEVGPPQEPHNTDGDTLIDALDADDDGDGLPTADELGRTCADGSTPAREATCPLGPWRCADGGEPSLVNRDGEADAPQQPDDLPDALDADDDGDGVPTAEESGGDRDGDGVPDRWDGRDADGPAGDPDADGLSNTEEDRRGSDPLHPDSDDDGIPDGLERAGDSDGDDADDLLDPDDDGDGLPTRDEGATDPDGDRVPSFLDEDSDGDGIGDAEEQADGDEDCDGVLDPWDGEDDGRCEDQADTGYRIPFDDVPTGCRCDGAATHPSMAGWLLGMLLLRRRAGRRLG